jgi:hypothetical protein
MSKFRTTTQLLDFLDKDFGWRVQEILNLRTALKTREAMPTAVLLRAGLPLIYAHWEGYVKAASEAFLSHVAHLGLTYRQLKPCFAVLGIRSRLLSLAKDGNAVISTRTFEFLVQELDSKARFARKGNIDTQANLSSVVFRQIASSVGIDPTAYETKSVLIDESLLKRRNHIAHGENLQVTPDEFHDLATEVITLMRQYKTDLQNSLSTQSYRA